jgi:hypothetical protein
MKEVHSPGTLKKNKAIDNRRRISGIANVRYISESHKCLHKGLNSKFLNGGEK